MDSRQRWTLILTSVASLMVGLDLTVVTTALNTIRLDLGASIAELDWTINAYTLTIGVLLLPAAAAGDRLGRRRVLAAGLAVFTASSAACARARQGHGTVRRDHWPGHPRGPGHRRSSCPGPGLAVDFLAERADRHCPDPAPLPLRGRSARPANAVRRDGPCPVGS